MVPGIPLQLELVVVEVLDHSYYNNCKCILQWLELLL